MAITTYTELQTAAGNWLDRADLSSRIPEFIALAEASLQKDERVRKLVVTTLSVDAATENAPTGFVSLEYMAHEGSTYYGPLEIVASGDIGRLRGLNGGVSGVPKYVAVEEGVFRFAPIPNATFTLGLGYWSSIVALATTSPNWLLTAHPDVYLYATLMEASPYLKDDERVVLWQSQLEDRLEKLHKLTERKQFSGKMSMRPRRVIGG